MERRMDLGSLYMKMVHMWKEHGKMMSFMVKGSCFILMANWPMMDNMKWASSMVMVKLITMIH